MLGIAVPEVLNVKFIAGKSLRSRIIAGQDGKNLTYPARPDELGFDALEE